MNFSDEAQWRAEWKRDKYAFYPSRTVPMARCFHSKYFLPLLQTRIHLRNDWGILEFSPRINDRVPLFVSFFFFFIVSQLLSRRKNVCLLGKRNLIASRWLWIYAVDLCSVSKYTVSPVIRGPIFHISFFRQLILARITNIRYRFPPIVHSSMLPLDNEILSNFR